MQVVGHANHHRIHRRIVPHRLTTRIELRTVCSREPLLDIGLNQGRDAQLNPFRFRERLGMHLTDLAGANQSDLDTRFHGPFRFISRFMAADVCVKMVSPYCA